MGIVVNTRNFRIKHWIYKNVLKGKYLISREDYDYYAASTVFMNRILLQNDLFKFPILSVGGVTRHIVADLPFYSKLVHNSMIPMEGSKWLIDEGFNVEYRTGDFFELQSDDSLNEVKTCISHVTIHCMNDTRYGNDGRKEFLSYKFANKLRQISPGIEHVIIAVPVNKDEFIMDNLTWLGDEKFIRSFEDSGFQLKDKLYDKKVNENVFDECDRFSKSFPQQYCKKVRNIIGNYHFVIAERNNQYE